MKRLNIGFVAMTFLVCFGLVSCATERPFTNKIFQQGVTEATIPNYQYYISEGILLSREESTSKAAGGDESGLNRGKLVLRSSQQRDEKFLEASTKCIVPEKIGYEVATNEYGEQRIVLNIAFEQNPDGSYPTIRFSTFFDPDDDEKYYLVFDDPKERMVTYNNLDYKVTFLDGSEISTNNTPYLIIKAVIDEKQSKSRKKIKGLKV